MDEQRSIEQPSNELFAGNVEVGVRCLGTLFADTDTVLFRPIETWVENGKKRSRVDYRNTFHCNALNVRSALDRLFKLSVENRLNLFFGVCPRFGGGSRFDLAWQVRTVRVLWTDIDHVTVDEANGRISESSLPQPSIVVQSGKGVHLYWLLEEPYLIDDVGDPAAVETEWVKAAGGAKKPRKFIIDDGDKIYLDQQRRVSRLSPKAEHLQDVLAGIANSIGGDHTTDLSRLLRVPGSFNRKNERNGKEPLPTQLVVCDPSQKYSLAVFEPLKASSPSTLAAQQIAKMPLPNKRKPSPTKQDKLAELIASSEIAPTGERSEADFAVCCFAIRNGTDREIVWSMVEGIGKFAEQGRQYFDHTWGNAEHEVRAATFEKLVSPSGSPPEGTPSQDDDENGDETIIVKPGEDPIALTLAKTTNRLLAAGDCFSRADQLVEIRDGGEIRTVLSPPELAGLLNQHVEYFFVGETSSEYKPFPPAYANTWLNNYRERGRLPKVTMFTRNPVFTTDWRLVEPGFDQDSGIYYAGPKIDGRDDTGCLDKLLRDFCFKEPADRTNFMGVLLTTVLMPHFIGSKPAAIFNGNQPELGKSILAQTIAVLRDGQFTETLSYNPNDEEFEKRIGAAVRRGATTIIVDNAKARGRNPNIDSACLERSITDPILSFRLLGKSETIRAENSHIFCITANSAEVSRDLVTRSVVINLFYEGDPKRRRFAIADPEDFAQQHRETLLGELVGMVERWKATGMPKASVDSRFNKRGWGSIIGGILDVCGEPDFMANADQAAAHLDATRVEFGELVELLADHPQGSWSAGELVDVCEKHSLLRVELGDGSARSKSTKMGTLAGRYLAERFTLAEGVAVFCKRPARKGVAYHVYLEEKTPNL